MPFRGGSQAGRGGTGISEVAGPIGRLQLSISPGYGFAAIIVAFVGRLHPVGIHDVWLDEISAVVRLPNPSPAETSSRSHPPDPNAPTPR